MALKHFNIPIVSKTCSLICMSCCIGKSHKIHAPLSCTNYNSPVDVVHTGMWRPSPFPSTSRYIYYVSFVYEFTKFIWIYSMMHKSEALHALKLYASFVQTQFHTTIKAVKSDYGGEYRPFTKYLIELDILVLTHLIKMS